MILENSYAATIARIKTEIETGRLKTAISVNQQLLILYWKIGNIILEQQDAEGWGTKVIERLSNDLRKEFPDMKGTSSRNLKYMRAFADAYPKFVQQLTAQIESELIVQAPLAQLQNDKIVQKMVSEIINKSIVQVPLAQLTWYHHITLIDKVKNIGERVFYIKIRLLKTAGAEMY